MSDQIGEKALIKLVSMRVGKGGGTVEEVYQGLKRDESVGLQNFDSFKAWKADG
jgi:hypothetical protein